MLYTTDSNGKRRFAIYQGEEGHQRLVINDQNGATRLYIGQASHGTPMLYTTYGNGKRRFAIYQDEEDSQELTPLDFDVIFDDDSVAPIDEES